MHDIDLNGMMVLKVYLPLSCRALVVCPVREAVLDPAELL